MQNWYAWACPDVSQTCLISKGFCCCGWFCRSSIRLQTFCWFWFLSLWVRVFKLNGLGNPQDRIAVCLSVVLPLYYALGLTSRLWSNGTFGAMDSGANIFVFPPVLGISGTIAPSLHCLTSATIGPAHVSLHSAEVMFGMRDSAGECIGFVSVHLYMLISHLLYFLFSLWVLRGVTLISMMQSVCSVV